MSFSPVNLNLRLRHHPHKIQIKFKCDRTPSPKTQQKQVNVTMSSSMLTLGLLSSSTISLVMMLTFNALSGSGQGGDLFIASVSDQSDRYQTLITPAGQHTVTYVTIYNLLSDRLGLHYLDAHIPVVGSRAALLCHNLLPSQKRRKVKHKFEF